MGWPFPFAKRAIRMRCVTDESRKVSSVILQKYQRHNILQKAEYLSRVSLPMNDPIPPRPRAAITGDSRRDSGHTGAAALPRVGRASMRTTAPPPGPCGAHCRPQGAALRFNLLHCTSRGGAGVAACRPAPGAIGGSSPWNPPACARGTSCPHPRRHPAAAPSARHLPTTHSTREDRSEPIAGAVSGAARLAQSPCTDTRCATTGAGAASALCAASWGAAPDPRSSPQPRVGASGGGSSTSCILTSV
jgi:hypothetical protein